MEQNIVNAEYQVVEERTLDVIASEIKIIEHQTAKTVLENGIQIGNRLKEAKDQCGHGNFEAWCRDHLNYSKSTAERFMKLAKEYGGEGGFISKTSTLTDLSISNALSLLKLPEEDREAFAAEHPVEDMTNKELEEEIRKLKESRNQDSETIDGLRREVEREREETRKAQREIEDLKRQVDDAQTNAAAPEEMETLKRKLEKAKTDLKNAKNILKEKEATVKKEIDSAIAMKREQLKGDAKREAAQAMQEVEAERERLTEENAALKRKVENSGNEIKLRFKILVDQLQDVFDQAGQCILVETDQDAAEKMNAALKAVIEKFRAEL